MDNITGTRSGHLYVAEDGGNMDVNIIDPTGRVAQLLRLRGHSAWEFTGPAFSADGNACTSPPSPAPPGPQPAASVTKSPARPLLPPPGRDRRRTAAAALELDRRVLLRPGVETASTFGNRTAPA